MLEELEDDIWVGDLGQVDFGLAVVPALFEFIIEYYTYQSVVDLYIPHLEVVSNYGDRQVVPFFGQVMMKLSADRYCTNCFKRVEAEDSLCDPCMREKELEFLRCVKEGPGLGKGYCDLKNPECGLEACAEYCARDHVIYLVIFGDGRMKVGMSRADRWFLRLLEQGASYAMVFQGAEDRRNLVETYLIEQRITEEFRIVDAVVFEEKLKIFRKPSCNLKDQITKLHAYNRIFKGYYQLRGRWLVDFRPLQFPIPVASGVEKDKLKLNGELIGFRGNVGYLKESGAIIAFDLNKLKGRKIENVNG